MKYLIEVDEEHLKALQLAAEVVARIGIGQVGEIARVVGNVRLPQELEKDLKKELHPELGQGHYGIGNTKVREEANVLWDIYQVVRNRLAHDNLKPGEVPSFTVSFDSPMKTSNVDLIKIKKM